ncbi:MAG: sensor histidine kinase [Actinomycetota bacterium]
MFRSLHVRMALSHAVVTGLVLLLIGGIGYVMLARSLDRSVTSSLQSLASAEADRISESGQLASPPDSDVPSGAAIKLAVFTAAGRPLGEIADIPSWLRPLPKQVETVRVRNESVRIITLSAGSAKSSSGFVVAGQSLAPEHQLLSRVRMLFIVGGLIAVLLAFGSGWLIANAAAQPIRRAYEAQRGFAANASHEFRTPLAFLRSGLELSAESDPELSRDMLREVSYLTDLTGKLLTLARSSATPAELEPVDVAMLCRGRIDRAKQALGVDAALQSEGDPVAMADATSLEAALDALLENVAVHGGNRATVQCVRSNGFINITIADHGSGIPAELHARATEPFFRADPARSRERGGAGLGLSIVRSLVESQSGSLRLGETPGGGLSVTITLKAVPS